MTWWKKMEPVYKALGAILGAIALGMALMTYSIGGKTSDNAKAVLAVSESNTAEHNVINARVYQIEEGQDTMKGDLALLRCWVLHEINGTDSRQCLASNRGGNP
jgi:hypothetical protein